MDQASCSSYGNRESKWTIECKDHFYFLPAWRRLRATLQKEFDNPDVIFFDEPNFQLVSWKDKSSELLEPFKKILQSDDYSFCMKFRGVIVTFTGIHLIGYFEEEKDSDRFDTLTDALKRDFKKYGVSSYNLSTLLTVPLCRFRTVTACEKYKSTQLLEWSQCEFGELRMSRWHICHDTSNHGTVPLQRFICHRGNLERKELATENTPSLLDKRIHDGYDVELDVWYTNKKLFLGHDKPEHPVTFEWLMQSSKKYIHTKDAKTLEYLLLRCGREGYHPNIFYHTVEEYALTTRNHVIVLPGQPLLEGSVNMMPEMAQAPPSTISAYAVCSDSLSNFSK